MDAETEKAARLKRKQEFYSSFNGIEDSDDDTPDPGRQASMRAMKKAAALRRSPPSGRPRHESPLARSASDTQVTERRKKETLQRVRAEQQAIPSSSAQPAAPKVGTSKTFSGLPSKPMAPTVAAPPKVIGKRKRTNEIKLVPQNQQIFKGLYFYFFPNNDTNPARKMRITKALERGASWVKDFDDTVTHVIVDKALDYAQLLKYLKQDSLPEQVVVASENYPAECISLRTLLNPRTFKFKVKGLDFKKATKSGSSSSDKSLLLKPAGKSVIARQPHTHSTERASSPMAPSESGDENEAEDAPRASNGVVRGTPRIQSTDEFDNAVRQARELKDVPLDNDDEPTSRPSSSEGPSTDDEGGQQEDLTAGKNEKTKTPRWQDKFQCMQKHTGSNMETPNASTIAILQQMASYYDQIGDQWRTRAYRKAMATLRNQPTKIMTRKEALALPQIGERLATKIEEIAYTSRLRRLDTARAEPSDRILRTFMQVYGVGYAQASKWVDAGFTTLDELYQKADLTPNQKIGIEHYVDFNSRIPRAEVEQLGNIVKHALQKIDPAFEVIIGGSYRRGAETSSDIDCIITRPDTGGAHIRQVVLDRLVPKLFSRKFLVAGLAATSRDDGSKWHGACQLPFPNSTSSNNSNPWRRIDLLLVPSAELGAALIYFTGNDIFNRSMRLLAGTKGMRLNQRGLYKDVIRGKGREKLSEGTLVEGSDEKRIFEVLGVPWRPPEHRIC